MSLQVNDPIIIAKRALTASNAGKTLLMFCCMFTVCLPCTIVGGIASFFSKAGRASRQRMSTLDDALDALVVAEDKIASMSEEQKAATIDDQLKNICKHLQAVNKEFSTSVAVGANMAAAIRTSTEEEKQALMSGVRDEILPAGLAEISKQQLETLISAYTAAGATEAQLAIVREAYSADSGFDLQSTQPGYGATVSN